MISGLGNIDCGCGVSVNDGGTCPPSIDCSGPTTQQLAFLNSVSCPSGYTKVSTNYIQGISSTAVLSQGDLCVDQFGLRLNQNQQDSTQHNMYTSEANKANLIMIGGVVGVVALPGMAKLLGVVAIIGGYLQKSFIGGM